MSRVQKLKQNAHRPTWWANTAFPHVRKAVGKSISQWLYSPEREPLRLMDEDWDNIIILDGCRYDLFEETYSLDFELNYRISLGSGTPEFLTKNFENRSHKDTVYVTANPIYRLRDIDRTFHEIIDVWEWGWDDELQTVPPDVMAEATIEAYEEFPNKRIISHFMQPHYPFIGELADEIGDHSGYEFTYRQAQGKKGERDNPTVWELLEEGAVSKDLVWRAYRENLEIALPHVETLLDHFDEKTVVTSDHGNALGERLFRFGKQMYGHQTGMRHDCLCKVPWVVEGSRRKEIIEEDSPESERGASEEVSERLADLGYADL